MENSLKHLLMKKTSVYQLTNWKICLFFLISFVQLNAQDKLNFEKYQKQYQGQPEVILYDIERYIIKKEKDDLRITQTRNKESLVLNELGAKDQKERFYSSELSPVIDYEAFLINKKNKKVKMKNFTESSGSSSSVFFDDVKKIEVIYSGIEPGVRKILNYETEFSDPNLLHRYVFKRQYAAEKLALEVEVDNSIELGYKLINDDDTIDFTKEKKGKKTIYKWIKNSVTPYKYEVNTPGILYYEPHVQIYIKNAEIQKNQNFLGDVPKLYAYYQTFVKNLNKDISQELKDLAIEISSSLDSEEEKVKAIYYWVKDNIKYIAYENGYEGFIPREANLVCERKFGDCKDMASIIKAMCNSVGIENVKLTWIGTREIPYTYEEVYTPAVDNHMIACYIKGDEYIFLDATDAMTKYPLPSSFIQGKQALVGINEKEFKLVEVPVVEHDENEITLTVEFSRKGDKLIGNGSNGYKGLSRTNQLYKLTSIDDKVRFNRIKNSVILGNNKFILKDYKEQNVENRDLPYIVNYDFELDNYIVEIGEEHFINLFLKSHYLLYKLKEDRAYPYELENKNFVRSNFIYNLQEGEEVTELPESIKIDNELIFFEAAYSMENNKIKLSYKLESKKLLLTEEDFDLWNESVKSIKTYMDNSLSIKQN